MAAAPLRAVSFDAAGTLFHPVRPVGEFLFTPEGEGTRVAFSLVVELAGVKKALMSSSVQKAMEGEVQAIEKAKSVLEA